MSRTHLFAIYFIYWPNNASKILIIKAHAALVYFYLQAPMKKYLSIKGVLITTNIPEKAYITSGTFHHSDTSDNLTLCYPSPVAHSG